MTAPRDGRPGTLPSPADAAGTAGTAPPPAPARTWLRRHILAVASLGVLGLYIVGILSLVVADLFCEHFRIALFAKLFRSEDVRAAMVLSAYTSLTTLLLVVLFCVPAGYALSRYRFPGHAVADTIVDLPLVVPPVVIGLSLLAFFSTRAGGWTQRAMEAVGWDRYAAGGVVLCQFLMAVPYAIRMSKAAFDGVDRRLEDLALTLGCGRLKAFWRVTLPLARNGIMAGCILAWARAVGVFGPLMIFVGCVRQRNEVMPTTIYLEVSTGGTGEALAVGLIMMAIAGAALVAVRALSGGRGRAEP